MKSITRFSDKKSATILTIFATIGVVATAIFAAKGAIEANDRVNEALSLKEDRCLMFGNPDAPNPVELTPSESIAAQIPAYIPAIISGSATIMCIWGANILNKRQQASITSAYVMLEKSFHEYRKKVNSLCGDGTDARVLESIIDERQDELDDRPPWDEPQTFYIKEYGKFFDRTMEEVRAAEYHINRNFILKGEVSFGEFLLFLGLRPEDTEYNSEDNGWSMMIGEAYFGYQWIDFEHRLVTMDDMVVTEISFPFPPHLLSEGPWDV